MLLSGKVHNNVVLNRIRIWFADFNLTLIASSDIVAIHGRVLVLERERDALPHDANTIYGIDDRPSWRLKNVTLRQFY
jgi:hypothetical protein